ncbi:hypothetical protein GGI23_000382 [Coemansia sp. RSA 2559]|nr:hypothetical protein GGI23_000382 [Coemansia sp. RSA 2559]KAJ2868915.1 hypothetical protein GGI22_000572 [Coemansia erecta]
MKIGEAETVEKKGIKEGKEDMALEALGIDKEIARALRELHGVSHATPMQAMLLNELLLHNKPTRNVVVRYETGAGKTLMTLAAVLSQAISDYHQLTKETPHKRSAIFDALAVNTIIVAPNRELAMQTEHWAHRLLLCAYPHLPAIKFVQRFVVLSTSKENEPSAEGSGGDTSRRELRVLARHGPPIIAVGTHRRLLEMLCDPANPLVVRPPALMRFMYEKLWSGGGEQQPGSSILRHVQERKRQLLAQEGRSELANYVGLRRLVIDEVDATLAVDSVRPRRMPKRRHAPKPRAGQVLVKSILEVCGSTVLLSHVLDTHSTEISYGATAGDNVYTRTLATSIGADEARDLSAATTAASATDARRLSAIFAGVSKAITSILSTHEDEYNDHIRSRISSNGSALSATATLPDAAVANADAEKCDVRMSDAALATVSPFSLQVVAVAATPTRRVRTWLRNNGCVPGDTAWLAPENGSYSTTPHTIQHHCIIIENESLVRNLRLKDSSSNSSAESYENDKRSEDDSKPILPLVNLTAEVAANVIEHFNPATKEDGGPVVIFTHPSADKSGLAKALRAYGIHARDILHHFGPEQQQLMMEKKSPSSTVYLVSEPAARGLDMPDASLVLILDTPSSATSYLHMAGRTGRFGRSGHAVTVMPMGMHGFYESKMRGIYAVLGIAPLPVSIVE